MNHIRASRVALLATVFAGAACGFSGVATRDVRDSDREAGADALDQEGSTRDGPYRSDGGDGAVPEDADAGAGTFRCGTATVPTCLKCEAGIYACAAAQTCVADCKTCGTTPVQCVGCAAGGTVVAVAVCESQVEAGACASPPLSRCSCATASDCPGARQVCTSAGCTACGEVGSDGLTCKGPPLNKHCDDDGMGNIADELTCR